MRQGEHKKSSMCRMTDNKTDNVELVEKTWLYVSLN